MNKLLLAVLVSGVGINAAQAAPALYGKLDVSVDRFDYDHSASNKDNWKVDSNSSLVGIKGDEKLTDDLSVFYLIEWQISTDGDGTDLGQRNRYLGLKSDKLGALKIGKFDSYVKRLAGGIDLFDNYATNTVDIAGTLTGENRLNNTVSYETPNFKVLGGDLQWNALLSSGEDNNDDATVSSAGDSSGKSLADAWSTSLNYKNNSGVSAGLGYDSGVGSKWLGVVGSPIATANIVRGTGAVNFKEAGLTFTALLQRATVDNANTSSAAAASGATPVTIAASIAALNNVDDETGYTVGARYQLAHYDKISVKAQYNHATTSFKQLTKDYDVDQIALGADYALNSHTRAYTYLAQNEKDNGKTSAKTKIGGVGLEYKF
ncbi:MAG: porin [Moraxellaceae bacterium]|nr:MAG: porin [Moraxellaceae bacterium]